MHSVLSFGSKWTSAGANSCPRCICQGADGVEIASAGWPRAPITAAIRPSGGWSSGWEDNPNFVALHNPRTKPGPAKQV
jgi:hypothetical protein